MAKRALEKHRNVDNEIFRIVSRVALLRHVKPSNLFDQRHKFLTGHIKNPKFEYYPPAYNTSRAKKVLEGLDIPNDGLGSILRERRDGLLVTNEVIAAIGNETKVRELCLRKLHKAPTKALVKKAEVIVHRMNKVIDERTEESAPGDEGNFSSKVAAKRFQKYLRDFGLTDWTVRRQHRASIGINSAHKLLRLTTQKRYSERSIKGTLAHEVFGHIFRAANGYRQPLKIFAIGLPSFLPTEEGVAVYLEEHFGFATAESKRRHALKVLAVNEMRKGKKFRQVFNYMKKLKADDDLAWELTYRVFRGGGFGKDTVYLKGYFMIRDYLRKGGKLKDLYFGKIALKHVPLCKKLAKQGVLKPPKYIPKKKLLA